MATESIETEIDLVGKNADPKSNKASNARDVEETPDVEIEVVDDTPEGDRGRKPRDPKAKTAVPTDEEIEQYGKDTQARFRQVKWEFHEERRAKEAWQREHGAAVDFAKRVHEENKRLRDLVSKGHKTMLESSKTAAENEIAALKSSLQAALESGQTQQAADLNAKIAAAAARAEAANHVQPISFEDDADPDRFIKQRDQQQQRPQVRITEAMQDWMEENPWFNQDRRMTAFAFGVHEELLQKNVRPESPRYFAEIDKAMRETFPSHFEEGSKQDEGSRRETDRDERRPHRRTVAGVTRTPAGRPNSDKSKVTLTASQVALARKLGLSKEQYASELMRLQESDNG